MTFKNTPRLRRSLAIGASLATAAAGIAAFGISSANAAGNTPFNIVLGVGSDQSQKIVTWYVQGTAQQEIQIEKGATLDTGAKTIIADSAPNTTVDSETFRTHLQGFSGSTAESLTQQSGVSNAHVVVNNLDAASTYTYRVGDGTNWSANYTFSTGTASSDFTFAAFGDPQIGSSGYTFNDGRGWAQTLEYIKAHAPQTELLVSTGDQVESANDEWDWTNWADPHTDNVEGTNAISNVLKTFTYAPQIGNHEGGYSEPVTSGGPAVPSGRAYEQHFYPPNLTNDASFFRTDDSAAGGASSTANRPGGDYWYTYKNVLFININSNAYTAQAGGNADAAHAAYIKDVVAKHGTGTKWQIVTFHHAIYSPADHANDADNSARRKDLTYTMSQQGIDLVIQGHDHAYSRSYELKSSTAGTAPSKSNSAEQPGAQAVSTGPGGVVYLTVDSSSGSKYYDLTKPDINKNGGDYGPDPLDSTSNKNDANQTRHWANSVESQQYVPTYVQVDVSGTQLKVTDVATLAWDSDANSAVKSNKTGQRAKATATVSVTVSGTPTTTTSVVPFGDAELASLGDQRPSASANVHHLQTAGAVTDQFNLAGGNTNAFPTGAATSTVTATATATTTVTGAPGAAVTITAAPTKGANSPACLNAKWNVKLLKAKHAKKKKVKVANAKAVLACK